MNIVFYCLTYNVMAKLILLFYTHGYSLKVYQRHRLFSCSI